LAPRKGDDEEEQAEGEDEQKRQQQETEWTSRVRVDEDVGVKKTALAGHESECPAKPKRSSVFPSCVEV
jgi:hypothetical protein